MSATPRFVRLRIRNRADDDDLVILSSAPGGDCLVTEPPDGEGQKIDWAEGKLETGSYSWYAVDKYQSADTRAITKQLADADARDQLLGNRAIYEESDDASAWTAVHTGYVVDYQLRDALEFSFTVGDTDRREQKAELFRTVTDAFDRVCCIIGGPVVADPPVAWGGTPTRAWGPVIDYGPARFQVIANPTGLVTSTNRVTLSLVSGVFPPLFIGQQTSFAIQLPAGFKISIAAEEIDRLARKYFEYDAEGKYKTDGTQRAQPWGSFPGLEAKLTKVIGGAVTRTFPIAQETTKAAEVIPGLGTDYPLGDYSALVANSNTRLIVAWDTATMGAQPSVGTQFDVLVYPRAIDEDNPLHVRGHPIDLHTAVNDQEGIPYNAASAAATKTALGALFLELRIEGPMKYADFTKKLKQACGYGVRYNADGEQEFFPTLTDEASVGTITANDIIAEDENGPAEVILKTATSSVISGVDYQLKAFRLWNAKVDDSDRPMDGVIAQDQLIEGRRAEDAVPGDRILTYDLPGQILLAGGAIVFNQAFALREWILAAGDVIIDRRGWAAKEGALEVLDTIPGKIGEYLDSEAPHQVNAKVGQDPIAQRGGTRKLQIVGRTKRHGTALLLLEDAGVLAQTAPDTPDDGTGGNDPNNGIPEPALSLAASTDNPNTVATVTATNQADLTELGADVELEYLNQTATPASSDSGASFGPLRTSEGTASIDAPAIPAGTKLWVRGRTKVNSTGQFSDWTAWASITLGPATNGGDNGGLVPAISLVASYDGSGVLSAEATGNTAVTSVKFAVGAAGGATPTDAAVRAAAADAAAPFTASALATMAADEIRTVAAYGYDALGNESAKATVTIQRKTAGAPVGAQYLVSASDATLTAERVVADSPTVAWDFSVSGVAQASVPNNAIDTAKAGTDLKTFAVCFDFYAAGDKLLIPKIPSAWGGGVRIVGARAAFLAGVTGSATFTVKSAPSVTGSFSDMIGAGTAPTITAAQASADLVSADTATWADRDLAAGEALEVGCATLSGGSYVTLELTLQRL